MKRLIMLPIFALALGVVNGQDMNGNPPKEIIKYYFVELISNPDRPVLKQETIDSLQRAHMVNLATLFHDGLLMLAGPFENGGGILILNVSSLEAAQALIDQDPHVKAGRLLTKIRPWYTAKGVFTKEESIKPINSNETIKN